MPYSDDVFQHLAGRLRAGKLPARGGRRGSGAAGPGTRVSTSRSGLGPPPAHLRQVLVVEEMRFAGLKAVLTLALVEDVGLEFPARVLLGRRHGRRGSGTGPAARPGPARAPRRTADSGRRLAGGGTMHGGPGAGSSRAQRGRRGMPPPAGRLTAGPRTQARPRPERAPGSQGGLTVAGMLAGPLLARRSGAAGRAGAPRRRAPRPGPHRARGPRRPAAQPPPGRRGPMDAASRARCLPALRPGSQAPGRCRSPGSVRAATAALGAQRPQQMVAERLAHSRGGAGRAGARAGRRAGEEGAIGAARRAGPRPPRDRQPCRPMGGVRSS